jgi:glucose/arabinose dehydrogenase
MDSHYRRPARRVATGLVCAAALALAAAPAALAETVETVGGGLDNPRGVALGSDGAVYVAATGKAGRQCQGKGESRMCLGTTGKIVRIANGAKSTVARRFISAGSPGGMFATGVHGVSVAPDGKVFSVMTSGPPALIKGLPKPARAQAGRLFDVSGGNLSAVARIDAVEWKQNLDKVRGDRNSNPYAVLALADRQIVVDAGANALLEVRDGKATPLAVIPKNGQAQAVPTSIAVGPDGDYYVGELAEGAGKGKARVWKIPAAGGAPSVHATGFTGITGVAFGPDGSLFVTEFARNPRKEDFRGRVVRVAPDGTRTFLGAKKLMFPTGAAVDSTGAVYVSNWSVLPAKTPKRSPFKGAGGSLVKITP